MTVRSPATPIMRRLVPTLLLAALLTACGSGGEGGGAPTDGAASAPDTVADDAAADAAAPFDPGTIDGGEPLAWTPAAVTEDGAAFPVGVQAGGMEADRVTLWTRTGGDAAVALRVFRESDTEGEIVLVADETHTADANGYVHARVDGLAPGTWYRYVFLTPGEGDGFAGRSAVGRVRTAFAPGSLAPLTISATHGTNWREQPYDTLVRAAERDPDLFLHLGDIGYYDQRHEEGTDVRASYRALWAENLGDPGYRAILARTGFVPVWDDHEVWNNYDPEKLAVSDPELFDGARDVFFESTAMPRLDDAPRRLWRSFRWGDTAELFVLDCRSERRPSTAGTAAAEYLSPEQMTWLKAGLQASPATFKVIANSVPISALPGPWWDKMHADSWGAYTAQRDELLDFVTEQGIANVYFLTGDIHLGAVTRLETEGPRSELYEVVCGPGGNRSNPFPEGVEYGYFPGEEIFPDDQFLFWSGRLAVTELTFDPTTDPPSVEVVFIDGETGEVNGTITLPER